MSARNGNAHPRAKHPGPTGTDSLTHINLMRVLATSADILDMLRTNPPDGFEKELDDLETAGKSLETTAMALTCASLAAVNAPHEPLVKQFQRLKETTKDQPHVVQLAAYGLLHAIKASEPPLARSKPRAGRRRRQLRRPYGGPNAARPGSAAAARLRRRRAGAAPFAFLRRRRAFAAESRRLRRSGLQRRAWAAADLLIRWKAAMAPARHW